MAENNTIPPFDKQAFLSGLAVGCSLEGWAVYTQSNQIMASNYFNGMLYVKNTESEILHAGDTVRIFRNDNPIILLNEQATYKQIIAPEGQKVYNKKGVLYYDYDQQNEKFVIAPISQTLNEGKYDVTNKYVVDTPNNCPGLAKWIPYIILATFSDDVVFLKIGDYIYRTTIKDLCTYGWGTYSYEGPRQIADALFTYIGYVSRGPYYFSDGNGFAFIQKTINDGKVPIYQIIYQDGTTTTITSPTDKNLKYREMPFSSTYDLHHHVSWGAYSPTASFSFRHGYLFCCEPLEVSSIGGNYLIASVFKRDGDFIQLLSISNRSTDGSAPMIIGIHKNEAYALERYGSQRLFTSHDIQQPEMMTTGESMNLTTSQSLTGTIGSFGNHALAYWKGTATGEEEEKYHIYQFCIDDDDIEPVEIKSLSSSATLSNQLTSYGHLNLNTTLVYTDTLDPVNYKIDGINQNLSYQHGTDRIVESDNYIYHNGIRYKKDYVNSSEFEMVAQNTTPLTSQSNSFLGFVAEDIAPGEMGHVFLLYGPFDNN